MKAYEVRGNYKKFAKLLFQTREVASLFFHREMGTSLITDWVTQEVIKGTGYGGRKTSSRPVGNFAYLEGFDNPTFDDVARAALEPHIALYGEFLSLKYDGKTRWLFNCTHLLTALDLETSIVDRSETRPYRINYLRGPLYFKSEILANEWVFLPAEMPGEVFVTDRFVKVVEAHNLTGFDFREIWDSSKQPPAVKPISPEILQRRDMR
jgi:hypothetical protein